MAKRFAVCESDGKCQMASRKSSCEVRGRGGRFLIASFGAAVLRVKFAHDIEPAFCVEFDRRSDGGGGAIKIQIRSRGRDLHGDMFTAPITRGQQLVLRAGGRAAPAS